MNEPSELMPRYVLLRQQKKVGPAFLVSETSPKYEGIYAFTNKVPYDVFCKNSPLGLTPYPLVKRYLQEQCSGTDNSIKLVIIDATDPSEAKLKAVSMRSVLETMDDETKPLVASYTIHLDQASKAYRVEKI